MRAALAAPLVLALALAGCVQTSSSQGLGGQSSTTTAPGFFQTSDQWSVTAGEERQFGFVNPSGRAYASFVVQIAAGTVEYRILDADGAEVWKASVMGPAQVTKQGDTAPGAPGEWRIVRHVASAGGQADLTVTMS